MTTSAYAMAIQEKLNKERTWTERWKREDVSTWEERALSREGHTGVVTDKRAYSPRVRSTPRPRSRGTRSRRRRRGSGRRPCPRCPPRLARPCPWGSVHGPRALRVEPLATDTLLGCRSKRSAAPMAAPRGVGFLRGAWDRWRGAGREGARWSGTLSLCQEAAGGDYTRQHATTYHTSPGVPGKKMGLEKSH